MEAVNKSKEEEQIQSAALEPEAKVQDSTPATAGDDTVKAREADEVARILAELDTPRVDDHEVSLDELKALLKKEKQEKKEAARKAKEAEEAKASGSLSEPVSKSEDLNDADKKAIDPSDYDIRLLKNWLKQLERKLNQMRLKKVDWLRFCLKPKIVLLQSQ
jgi:hypothetical protein